MALIAITACSRLEDYKQAILHTHGEVRIVDHAMAVAESPIHSLASHITSTTESVA